MRSIANSFEQSNIQVRELRSGYPRGVSGTASHRRNLAHSSRYAGWKFLRLMKLKRSNLSSRDIFQLIPNAHRNQIAISSRYLPASVGNVDKAANLAKTATGISAAVAHIE